MLKVCSGVTNEDEKDREYKRSGQALVGRTESDRSSAMSSGGGLETEASAPVGEMGWSRKVGVVPPRPGLPIGDWIALLAYHSDTWAGP